MIKKFVLVLSSVTLIHVAYGENSSLPSPQAQEAFANEVAPHYQLTAQDVQNALAKATYQPSIISSITKPAEGKSYGDYRRLLLTPQRIQAGKSFVKSYAFAFNKEKKLYGVPPEMIAAIIGVETFYGKNTGKYKVLDALATLSFGYPKRAEFFQKELAQYISLAKKNHWPVDRLKGSYAGAFGWSQFMPSSYLRYAVSAYPGASSDLYNPNDAILSVANYFDKSGWIPGGPVAVPVKVASTTCAKLTCGKRQPLYSVREWRAHGVEVPESIPDNLKASVVTFDMDKGPQTWMIFNNFYVITCYNISINYAMAVYELSQAIEAN